MNDDEFYNNLDKVEDERIKKYIKNKNNRKYIFNFDKKAKLDRKTPATRSTNKQKLVIIFKNYINKDWKQLKKSDFEAIVSKIDNSNYAERTKSNYKKIIKMFDRFLNKGECSKNTKWIAANPIKRKLNGLQRDDLLNELDKKKLLNSCDNKRDYAIISLWLETGLRPKEMRVLTVGSVTFDKDLAYIDVPQDTKTGNRTIPIYFSKTAILDYLNEHPARDNKESPLWTNKRKNEISELHIKGFNEILRKIKIRSGIKKRLYWYLARHTSYTDKVAQGWNEGILKEYHGIDQSSSVLNRYVHLSGEDLRKKVKEYYGLEKGTKRGPDLMIVKCLNCQAENQNNNIRCKKCGYIISPEEMQKELKKKQKIEKESEDKIKAMEKQMTAMQEKMNNFDKAMKIINLYKKRS